MSIKSKVFLILSAVITFLSLIVYFIIMPTIKDIQEINNSIIAEKKDLELKYQRGQLAKKINNDFKLIQPDKEKLRSMFIFQDEELKFIENLEEIKQEFNIIQEITLIEEKTALDSQIIKKLPLKINLSGDFIQILKYINKLEKMNYYFNVNDIKIDSKDPKLGTVNAILTGNSFSLIQKYETPKD